MKIVAPIPVFGRIPLVKLTIQRLKNQKVIPIVITHEPEVKELCKNLDTEFVHFENDPLGKKWNVGFLASKNYNPDSVLFVGSSDWCSDAYLEEVKKNINCIVGMLGCHFVDVSNQIKLIYWEGYPEGDLETNNRHSEPIGIGRSLSREFLDKIGWLPFDSNLNASLDWSMWEKVQKNKYPKFIVPENPERVNLLSISTNSWINKHKFKHFFEGRFGDKIPLLKGIEKNTDILKKEFLDIFELEKILNN